MLFKKILNFILGYVRISVEGYFVERFINICISKRILLSQMERKKSNLLNANLGTADFRKVKQIAKVTKCKVRIIARKGIPFIMKRYKKRKIFVLLLGVIFCLIMGLSNFIWNIEITCEEGIDKEELISQLKEYGLYIGKSKTNLNVKEIIESIRLKRDDIAWIGINIQGTNSIVEIVKAVQKPEVIKEDEYCNIISDKEGIISKINVQNGTALVKAGEVIKKRNNLSGRLY